MATISYKSNKKLISEYARGLEILVGSIAFDDSYPTGGEALDLSAYFPTAVELVTIENNSGYIFEYDYTAKKVLVKYPTKVAAVHTHVFAGDELAVHGHKALTVMGTETAGDITAFVSVKEGDGTAQAGVTVGHAGEGADVDIMSDDITGGTPAGTNADGGAITAGVAEEVANEGDLSALTDVRFMAIGY